MNNSLVFIDEAFLSKLSKYFGSGKYIKFDRIVFAKNIADKEKMICLRAFLYTAPPYQSEPPTKEEERRKKGYDKFIRNISKNETITIREGRCQRLKIDEEIIYKQKYVDVLLTIDLMRTPLKFPSIKRIILVSSDSDFIPAIEALEEFNIKVILYTYYEKNRNTNFSRSNQLIKAVYKYILLTEEDLKNAPLEKNEENI